MVRKSQIKAQSKWEQKVYDKVLLRLRKDAEPTREQVAAAADQAGESVNEYIINAIMQRMNGGNDPPEQIEEIERIPFFE